MKGIFLDTDSILPDDLEMGPLAATLDDWQFAHSTQLPAQATIAEAEILVTNKIVLDDKLIANASGLKLICVAATGTNNIDLESARNHGVIVCNARGYATSSVVEHIFATLLTLNRQLDSYRSEAIQKQWPHSPYFCVFDRTIHDLSNKTMGIIGYGELGRATAEMARAFGMRVLIAEREGSPLRPGRVSLNKLLACADVTSLHCPLNTETENLIDSAAIDRMKKGSILINTARGGLVNEAALMAALSSNHLSAASLDVLSVEPPPADHCLLKTPLPNLVLTPHIAWASHSARQRLVMEIAKNITAYLNGATRNLVN
ncbi:MAG: D-2-hydroxyacid dehydrogenase [Gammaproteobacteria bacterium]